MAFVYTRLQNAEWKNKEASRVEPNGFIHVADNVIQLQLMQQLYDIANSAWFVPEARLCRCDLLWIVCTLSCVLPISMTGQSSGRSGSAVM